MCFITAVMILLSFLTKLHRTAALGLGFLQVMFDYKTHQMLFK